MKYSRLGGRMGDALTDAGLGIRHILSAAEASLRRLNTDYRDLYQVHFDNRITPLEETLRALDNLVRRGIQTFPPGKRRRRWGCSARTGTPHSFPPGSRWPGCCQNPV
jgi:aryl-alcohol dehydrogenase-like predicted oxidoreductase